MDETFRLLTGRRTFVWTIIALLAAGCDSLGTTKKFANPVMPPPPRQRLLGKNGENGETSNRMVASAAIDGDSADGADPADADAPIGHASMKGSQAATAGGSTGKGNAPLRTASATKEGSGGRVPGKKAVLPGATGEPGKYDELLEVEDSEDELSDEQPDGWKGNASDRKPPKTGKPSKPRTPTEELTAVQSDTATEGAGKRVGRGEVAATVNGRPIFIEDILHPMAAQLAEAEKQIPPELFRKERKKLVEKMIQPHIERELLLQALGTKVKEEQLTQIQKHIDSEFDEELREKLKTMGMSTKGEFEIHLRRAGSSLEVYKTNYRNQRLAQQYLQSRATHKQSGFDRPDMIEHWKGNPEKYAIPARAKWQQIRLTYSRHGGKSKTHKLAEEIKTALENGGDFGDLARQHSDGATASNGGMWDWTNAGSLASKEIDQALFELPVGEEFAMIESKEGINIVVVLDRQLAGTMAFESVQTDIKNELKAASQVRFIKELLAELRDNATIEMSTL